MWQTGEKRSSFLIEKNEPTDLEEVLTLGPSTINLYQKYRDSISSQDKPDKTKTLLIALYREAFLTSNHKLRVFCLTELANMQLIINDFRAAMLFITGAIKICSEHLEGPKIKSEIDSQSDIESITSILLALKKDITHEYLSNKCKEILRHSITYTFKNISSNDIALPINTTKTLIKDIYSIGLTAEKMQQIAERITKYYINITQHFIALLFEQLPKPPCTFNIIALGSMNRKEMLIYSDFEFAILVSTLTPEIQTYFINFTKILELFFITYGETPINPAHLWGIEVPEMKQGYRLDVGGSPNVDTTISLINTPEKLAQVQLKNPIYEIDGILQNSLRDCVSVWGNDKDQLFLKYKKQLSQLFKNKKNNFTLKHQRSLELLKITNDEHPETLGIKKMGAQRFDLKNELYRMPSNFMAALALYNDIEQNNVWEIITLLYTKKQLNNNAYTNLVSLFNLIFYFRLRVRLFYGDESEEAAHIAEKSYDSIPKNFILQENDILLLSNIYNILIPLRNAMHKFLDSKGEDNPLITEPLLMDNFENKIYSALMLNQHSAAKEYCEYALSINPSDYTVNFNYGFILSFIGKSEEAILKMKIGLDGFIKENLLNKEDNITFDRRFALIERAITMAEQIIAIYRSSHNEKGMALFLREIMKLLPKLSLGKEGLLFFTALGIMKFNSSLEEKTIEDTKAANELYYELITGCKQNHYITPFVASIYYGLAENYARLKQWNDSFHIAQNALKIYQQYHADYRVAETNHLIGVTLYKMNRYEEALKSLESCLSIYAWTRDKNTLSLYRHMGAVWKKLNNLIHAAHFYEKALFLAHEHYGSKSKLSGNIAKKLTTIYRKLNDIEKAFEHQKLVVEIGKACFGEKNLILIEPLTMLAILAATIDNFEEASRHLEEAKLICSETEGDPTNLFYLDRAIGYYYLLQKNHEAAEPILLKVIKFGAEGNFIDEKTKLEVFGAFFLLSSVYFEKEQWLQFINWGDKVIFFYKKHFSSDADVMFDAAVTLSSMGIAHINLEQFDNAYSYLNDAINYFKTLLSESEAEISNHYANANILMSKLFIKLEDYNLANDYITEGLQFYTPKNLHDLKGYSEAYSEAYHVLGVTEAMLGDLDKSLLNMEKAVCYTAEFDKKPPKLMIELAKLYFVKSFGIQSKSESNTWKEKAEKILEKYGNQFDYSEFILATAAVCFAQKALEYDVGLIRYLEDNLAELSTKSSVENKLTPVILNILSKAHWRCYKNFSRKLQKPTHPKSIQPLKENLEQHYRSGLSKISTVSQRYQIDDEKLRKKTNMLFCQFQLCSLTKEDHFYINSDIIPFLESYLDWQEETFNTLKTKYALLPTKVYIHEYQKSLRKVATLYSFPCMSKDKHAKSLELFDQAKRLDMQANVINPEKASMLRDTKLSFFKEPPHPSTASRLTADERAPLLQKKTTQIKTHGSELPQPSTSESNVPSFETLAKSKYFQEHPEEFMQGIDKLLEAVRAIPTPSKSSPRTTPLLHHPENNCEENETCCTMCRIQ